jgi:hypothetical protein
LFEGFFVCKLKKLSNDKKRPGGNAEEDEEEDEGEGEEEEKEDGLAPVWAEDGGAAKARAKAGQGAGKTKKPAPSEGTVVPVSRPKSNPKTAAGAKSLGAGSAKQPAAGTGKAAGFVGRGKTEPPAGLPRDLGNPGPGDILGGDDGDGERPDRKPKAEPSIVRAAKRVSSIIDGFWLGLLSLMAWLAD